MLARTDTGGTYYYADELAEDDEECSTRKEYSPGPQRAREVTVNVKRAPCQVVVSADG
jgi:hypothetical protein